MSKQMILVAVALSGWLVAGTMLILNNQDTFDEAAGTIGRSRVDPVAAKTVTPGQVFELDGAKLAIGNIGLLNNDAELLMLRRTKDTPEKVTLDVDYSYYLSDCVQWSEDEHGTCASYVRTERIVPGGTRIALNFGKAAPITGDDNELVTVRLSTREDERLHAYSEVASNFGPYSIRGNGSTRISFVSIGQ